MCIRSRLIFAANLLFLRFPKLSQDEHRSYKLFKNCCRARGRQAQLRLLRQDLI